MRGASTVLGGVCADLPQKCGKAALSYSTQCDGAVMVIESGSISYRLEQRVKGQLEKSGCRILGVVLNKVSMERNGYYSKYYGKYGKYSKYGHYGKYDRYEKAEA